MTLPASGTITLGQVATELGIGLPLTLGDSRVRALASVPSGSITLGQLRGKSAYTPMTLMTTNGSGGPANSETSGGTVAGQASVSVTGGSGGISIQWTVTSNLQGATIGTLTASSVTASRTFTKLSNGSATVLFDVAVTDNTGHTVTASGIEIDLYWGNAN